MKLDHRLDLIFSSEEIQDLVKQANQLLPNEGKMMRVTQDGYAYKIFLTNHEIGAFPL